LYRAYKAYRYFLIALPAQISHPRRRCLRNILNKRRLGKPVIYHKHIFRPHLKPGGSAGITGIYQCICHYKRRPLRDQRQDICHDDRLLPYYHAQSMHL
jgi:hypothetical protein